MSYYLIEESELRRIEARAKDVDDGWMAPRRSPLPSHKELDEALAILAIVAAIRKRPAASEER